MFKTDPSSLERLSFEFDEREISLLSKLFDLLKRQGLSTTSEEEVVRLQDGLAKIIKLKLEGKIYAFHVEDSFVARESWTAAQGVELYLRQGDKLRGFCLDSNRERVPLLTKTLEALKQAKINLIYTGDIDAEKGFLGLRRARDEDDPKYTTKLGEYEILQYTKAGVEVIVLDKLI